MLTLKHFVSSSVFDLLTSVIRDASNYPAQPGHIIDKKRLAYRTAANIIIRSIY